MMADFTLHPTDATEGERALLRIADALEAGELPDTSDAGRLIDAAALIRAMLDDRSTVEERREAFTRKIGMVKAGHRTPAQLTVGDIRDGRKGPQQRAFAFWLARANGSGVNAAIRDAANLCACSESSVKNAKRDHPEARHTVLLTYRDALRIQAKEGRDIDAALSRIEALMAE